MSAPVGASAEGSCRPEGRRLPVVVGVREAVEVAAVPLQLRRAPVGLSRPPLPASNMTYDAHSRIQGPRVLHPLRGVLAWAKSRERLGPGEAVYSGRMKRREQTG